MLKEGPPRDDRDDARGPEAQRVAVRDDVAPVLRCGACDAPITRPADRIERFGAHLHDRVNPAGHAFTIGCFQRADGARELGAPSDEFPWFPKHAWQIAVCAACMQHLGWYFVSPSTPPFFGLIVDRLVER